MYFWQCLCIFTKITYGDLEVQLRIMYTHLYTYTCSYDHEQYTHTILPQIMARAFISFQQLFTLATKQDRRLYETSVY